MTKFITKKILFCFLLAMRVSFLAAGPADVAAFNVASGDVLVVAQDVIHEWRCTGSVKRLLPKLQGCLQTLLERWTPLSFAEQNELEDLVDAISKSVLTCFQLIVADEPVGLSVGHPALFSLLLLFIHEDFREVICVIDKGIAEGTVGDCREMLFFVKSSLPSRDDISRAEKKIIMNLVQNYLSPLHVEEPRRSLLFDEKLPVERGEFAQMRWRHGRRDALAPGGAAACADAMAVLHLDGGDRDDVDSLPHDPDALFAYIEEHFLTTESLMHMKEEVGGASSSRDEPINVHPLLNDLERILARADLLVGERGAAEIAGFKRRLAELHSRC